ncbi:MAG: hypothetical protein QM647_03110 [Asticcacaulis sp.]|uniref:hypothetical protein n=1 Tax=Asticcacaulis sp. TaxID=1872648 RepID=UPI0039E6B6DE
MIHIAGVVGLLFLAALTLPRADRHIEDRLQSELSLALTDRGLAGIEGHFDGQTLTLRYARNAIDTIDTDNASLLAPRMAEAQQIAERLTGGMKRPAGDAGLWGPVTHISVDEGSVDSLARQMEMRRSHEPVYEAAPYESDPAPPGGLAFAEAP